MNASVEACLAAITRGTALGPTDYKPPRVSVIDVADYIHPIEAVTSGDPRSDNFHTETPTDDLLTRAAGRLLIRHRGELEEIVDEMAAAERKRMDDESLESRAEDYR